MPMLQGALYIKNCHSLGSCWFASTDSLMPIRRSNTPISFEVQMRLYKPWQRTLIRDNFFYNNHANVVMFES